jgi:hypothetical protein
MLNLVSLLVVFVLVAIVVRLTILVARLNTTIARQAEALRLYADNLADYESALWEWVDYSNNLKDRLHGVDSYPITAIESKAIPLIGFESFDGSAKTQPISGFNLAGYALPANESKTADNANGNGKHNGKAESKDSKSTDSGKYAKLIGKLGKLDSEQTTRANELLAKWYGKDGKSAESKSEEYLKRLRSALKL